MPTDEALTIDITQPGGQGLPPEPPAEKTAELHSWVDPWLPNRLPWWVDIMLRPRRTIRAIVDDDPRRYWVILAVLQGALLAQIDLGLSGWSQLVAQLILGGLLGLLGVYLTSGVLYFLGWIFRGKATHREVIAAVVWTAIPTMIAGVLWFGLEIASWVTMGASYAAAPPHAALDSVAGNLYWVVTPILALSSFGLFALCFAEVNRFALWRSVAAMLLPFLLFGTCFGIMFLASLMNMQ